MTPEKRSQTLHHGDKENLFDVTRLFFKNNTGTNALAFQHNHTGRLILKQRHSECTSMFVKNPHLITMSYIVLTNKEIAFQMNKKVTQVTLSLIVFR
jgi:hypothetical protein